VYNLRDFPGDAEIRSLADSFLKLYWHDVAHDFNKRSGVQGATGTRMYQNLDGVSPGSVYYDNPRKNWVTEWSYVYDWHDFDPGTQTHPSILVAADSSFVPLSITRELALTDNKAFEYASRRPGALNPADGQTHWIRRDVSTNDAFTMGALTYHPLVEHSASAAECIWYSVTVNVDGYDRKDRLLLTGIGEKKGESSVYADYFSLNGTSYADVIIAARRKIATHFQGIKVYLSEGALRDNFEMTAPDAWMFTRSGDAYIAIRIPEPSLDFYAVNGQISTIRMDGGEDNWRPIVIQAGQAKDFTGFQNFKDLVNARPYTFDGNKVTYVSLRNHTYEMARQEASESLPKVNGSYRNLAPPYTFSSPYLYMAWGSNVAELYGPSGGSATLTF